MADRYQRPDWVRGLNAMGPASGGSERMVPLVADHLRRCPHDGRPTPARRLPPRPLRPRPLRRSHADPVAVIERAYAGIGREVTTGHREAVVAYLRDKPRGKQGAHRYTAEDWGFDPDALHPELAEYMAQFDVSVEP